MLSKIDNLIHDPAGTLEEISVNRNLGLGLLGYGVSAFSWAFMLNIQTGSGILGFLGSIFLFFLVFILIGFFFAASGQIFLDFFTKKGSSLGLFSIIGISGFADILFVSFSLIANARAELNVLGGLFAIIVLLFKFFFLIYLISKGYKTSKVMSFFSLVMALFPIAVVFFIGMLGVFFAIGALIKSIA